MESPRRCCSEPMERVGGDWSWMVSGEEKETPVGRQFGFSFLRNDSSSMISRSAQDLQDC